MKKFKPIRVAILLLSFLISIFYQPNWIYENFWSRADFYDALPVTVPFFMFLIIYSTISTLFVELIIRFVKKYA